MWNVSTPSQGGPQVVGGWHAIQGRHECNQAHTELLCVPRPLIDPNTGCACEWIDSLRLTLLLFDLSPCRILLVPVELTLLNPSASREISVQINLHSDASTAAK